MRLPSARFVQIILVNIFVITACSQLRARQNAVPNSDQQTADKLCADSKWQPAAGIYADIVAKDPQNAQAWSNLGECNLQLQKFDDALKAFQHAADLNFRPLITKVDLARVYVSKGDTQHALGKLKEIEATGQAPRMRAYVASVPELQKLRDNAEYQQFLKATIPCQTAEFRQFDFWIGDWAVENPAGQKVGDNLVTREQDGCLLVEHWKSGRGIETGTSFNYYDIRDKKFHQIYFDNSGNAGAYPPMAGGLVDNKMVMISDETSSPVFRWTWYTVSPGKVRQMAEQSDDGEKSWHIVWDSTYVNKRQQAGKTM
jgi:hypothetical protein